MVTKSCGDRRVLTDPNISKLRDPHKMAEPITHKKSKGPTKIFLTTWDLDTPPYMQEVLSKAILQPNHNSTFFKIWVRIEK